MWNGDLRLIYTLHIPQWIPTPAITFTAHNFNSHYHIAFLLILPELLTKRTHTYCPLPIKIHNVPFNSHNVPHLENIGKNVKFLCELQLNNSPQTLNGIESIVKQYPALAHLKRDLELMLPTDDYNANVTWILYIWQNNWTLAFKSPFNMEWNRNYQLDKKKNICLCCLFCALWIYIYRTLFISSSNIFLGSVEYSANFKSVTFCSNWARMSIRTTIKQQNEQIECIYHNLFAIFWVFFA